MQFIVVVNKTPALCHTSHRFSLLCSAMSMSNIHFSLDVSRICTNTSSKVLRRQQSNSTQTANSVALMRLQHSDELESCVHRKQCIERSDSISTSESHPSSCVEYISRDVRMAIRQAQLERILPNRKTTMYCFTQKMLTISNFRTAMMK